MCRSIFLTFFLLGGFTALAQTKPICPEMEVKCSEPSNKQAQNSICQASLPGIPKNQRVAYSWTVSCGLVVKQGQTEAIIDVSSCGGRTVTVKAEAKITATECSLAKSYAFSVLQTLICDRPLDDFVWSDFSDAAARLDNLAVFILQEPRSTGYIVVYGPSRRGANRIIEQAKKYLSQTRGIKLFRLKAVYGGYRQRAEIAFWGVPKGAKLPKLKPESRPVAKCLASK